ncbi:Actin-related protein 4 [Venturia nashicola]|uniref:Actin-related protein 4 n=1 Tax=Venturia nashicola TaxID=86259 RepID=A0A4Z1NI47_9PEZI|nr:Actin-related protein 4 [Venturia nashicola]TLD20036.1 Actin-related protein 4 [Venturia nashicola]
MSTPPKDNEDLNSQLNRRRAPSKIAPAQLNLPRRTLTGRIGRSPSASSLPSSTRNRRAVDSQSARDRSWQYNQAEQTSQAQLSLPEYIAPQSSAVPPTLTAASTKFNLPPLEPISHLEEPSVLVGEATHLGRIGGNQEEVSSMEIMVPTQYQPHEQSPGHSHLANPALNIGYINQYSRAESAIRSPSYHGAISSPQQSYLDTTAAQGHPYAPAYSAPSEYAHTQYAQTYGGHYSSSYQQPHTPAAIEPQQQYGQPYPRRSPGYVDTAGVRVVDVTQREARCYEHGCNGRLYSNFSNLLRHQREKSGKAKKVRCTKCGKLFTRSTAMKSHMMNKKCKRESGSRHS